MRNVDKIKRLEHELGRYKKMVGDREKEVKAMERRMKGYEELQQALAAHMVDLALRGGYTEEVGGEEYKNCLRMKRPKVGGVLDEYTIRCIYADDDEMVMQALKRENADG